jgi:hypothetical protein
MSAPTSMTLTQKFTLELSQISSQITHAYVAVGMITQPKFDFALRQFKQLSEFRIVLGLHMPTPPNMMERLYDLQQAEKLTAKVYAKRFFHPKLYIFKLHEEWIAYVGSGNFTNGGWHENEELFVKITDQKIIEELIVQFLSWETDAVEIDEVFLENYRLNYSINNKLEIAKRRNLALLADKVNAQFNMDNVDFSNQFFAKSDFMTFHATKTREDSKEVIKERNLVRDKLYHLDQLVSQALPEKWDLHHHYIDKYIAAQVETKGHDEKQVNSLWVGYGRDEPSLKRYGDDATPLHFMRLQFIIHYDSVGFWLMPGKAGSGMFDRSNLKEKMDDDQFCALFYEQFVGLGDYYWIDVSKDRRWVKSFSTAQELNNYIKKDRPYDYFTIGRDYLPGDERLSSINIVQTCISDFGKFYPLYKMILHNI